MLIRIVRMEFQPERVGDFLAIFKASAPHIQAFDGCEEVQLKKDSQRPHVYYTHSRWKSEAHLNRYRDSDFFKETWSKTKLLFNGKPQAFSLVEP